MLAAVDVLRVVAARGPVTFDELEAAIPCPPGRDDGFGVALDAAVDHGFLRIEPHARLRDDRYRLTGRGRRLLAATARGSAAA